MSSEYFARHQRATAAELLRQIVEAYEVTDEGNLATPSTLPIVFEGVLIQSMKAPKGLDAFEVKRVAAAAIEEAIRSRNPDFAEFERSIDQGVSACRATSANTFTLVTRCHFSLGPGQSFELVVPGARATFSTDTPEINLTGLNDGHRPIDLDQPSGGAYCTITYSARDALSALGKGAYFTDLVFGAVCYALHFGRISVISEVGRPLAIAFPGKEVGLVDQSGQLHPEFHLFFPVVPSSVFRTDKDIPSRVKPVEQTLFGTGDNARSRYYSEFLAAYFQALSEADADNRFVKLWRVAELLTRSTKDADICEKIAAPFKDRHLVAFAFEALRKRRNEIVHQNTNSVHEEHVFEVCRDLIERFVWRSASSEFPKLSHWLQFLELGKSKVSAEELDVVAAAVRKRDAAE